MKGLFQIVAAVICGLVGTGLSAPAQEKKKVEAEVTKAEFAEKVVILSLSDSDISNSRRVREWERLVKRVNEEKARSLVLELNVRSSATDSLYFEKWIDALSQCEVPTVAYVNKRAIGLGALLALG